MPDRIIRAELLDSEPWLALKDNADRAAWLACALNVDNFGDMAAGPQRLVKLWRPYGIDTPEKASKVFADLADVDLVRAYTVEGKPYLHIPRFRQYLRYVGKPWPLSPWATIKEKQFVAKNSPVNHGESRIEVEVEVEIEKYKVKPSRANADASAPVSAGDQSAAKAKVEPRLASLQSSDDKSFARFWASYPRKRAKGDAANAWAKIKPDDRMISLILAAVERAARSDDWKRDGGRYIPHPATWLNGRRWEDEIEQAGSTARALGVREVL